MKTILFILLIGFTTSCVAQKRIASLENNITTKANVENYTVKKQQKKVKIENAKNRLHSLKQSSPNLPINMSLRPYYIKLNTEQLAKIFAKNIASKDLEILASNKNAGILIDLRTDVAGKILEVSFFTDDNSILDLKQLEFVENEIKKANQLIVIKPEIGKYIRGSNFLLIDTRLAFVEILKIKKSL